MLDTADALPELDIQAILRELVEAEVDFFLIGGVAVGYHGHIPATKDVDIVPSPDPGNLKRLAGVLRSLEAQVEGAEDFGAGEVPDPLDPAALELEGNWMLSTRLGRLYVMQWIGETPLWRDLSDRAVEDTVAGLPIKIVAYEDLVRLKEIADRPEDRLDLQRLREVREG